jgi:pimeloyl-ACP methyl ester carboxylesterase
VTVHRTSATLGSLTFDLLADGPDDGGLVVLLHGFPQSADTWDAVIPLLAAAGHRVVAPSLRGYSPGARPDRNEEYRVERSVADVLALADHLGAERFSVVGHDWGGAVVWALAAAHPARLLTATAVSTPHPRAMASVLWRSTQALQSAYIPFFRLPVVSEAMLGAGGAAVLGRALRRSGLGEQRARAYTEAMRRPGALTGALRWYRAASMDLARIGPSRAPTMYVWSSGDAALGRPAAEATADHVEAPYRFEVLEGVAHWVPEEAPTELSALLLDHLATGAAD